MNESLNRKIRVAVVYGGRSTEHGVSTVSAGSVLAALDPTKYDVVTVGITPAGKWVLTDVDPTQLRISSHELPAVGAGAPVVLAPDPTGSALTRIGAGPDLGSVDVVFPVLHGRFGEDGTIQGLLEMAGIPYVGAGVLASAAGMDKAITKKLLAADGLAVGRYLVVRAGETVDPVRVDALGYPVFVKPARAGSSIGITKVRATAELTDALAAAFVHDDKVLIEAGVIGREIECGVLQYPDGRVEASLPAEIRLVGSHDWYDFEAKYLDDACEFDIPAKLDDDVTAELQNLAVRAFRALEGSGLARVDFFVTDDGQPIVNEVNTMPGFTPISMYPRMFAASGMPYPQLLDTLIQTALARFGR